MLRGGGLCCPDVRLHCPLQEELKSGLPKLDVVLARRSFLQGQPRLGLDLVHYVHS